MFQVLVSLTETVLTNVVHAAWQAGLLALIVLAITWLLKSRLQPRWRFALWLVVFARLALPILPASPWSVFQLVAVPARAIPSDVAWPVVTPMPETNGETADRENRLSHDGPVASSAMQIITHTMPPPNNAPPLPARRAVSPLLLAASIWIGGVVLLLLRFGASAAQLRRQQRTWEAVSDHNVLSLLRHCCKELRLKRDVTLYAAADNLGPATCGIVRHCIVLPRSLIGSFSPTELRLVLLHELVHIRRHDVLVDQLVTVITIVHWFHPVAWIARYFLRRERELTCDAAVLDGTMPYPAADYGHVIVKTIETLSKPAPVCGLVGMFSLGPFSLLHQRIRLIAAYRPPTWPSLFSGAALLAAFALVGLTDAQTKGPPSNPAQKAAATTTDQPAAAQKTFDFLVVGPDARPIPEVNVEVRSTPIVKAEQILQGKFLEAGTWGPHVKSDATGRLVITLPVEPERFSLGITTPGYGPYWASWNSGNHSQPIPSTFTAELEPAWSVGGIVVDENERPVEGAKVHPSIRFKKRLGDLEELHIGDRLTTDAEGKWWFDSVPVSMNDVGVEITHPKFMPRRRGLPRSQFGIDPGTQPIAQIKLERGLVVSGRVTDEQGQPIAEAVVRTKFLNDIRQATTDESGVYQLVGCEPRMARIVVSAKGRATDMQEVRVGEGLKPVDFKLPPGGKVRIRVLDEQGEAVPKARIFFQRWRGSYAYFEFGNVNQYADQDGIWQWNEAPVDDFEADICRPDGMQLGQQSLAAREAEYVFRLPPALVITGKVVDAETREPIKSFRVVPGVRSSESHMNWVPNQTFTGADGQFVVRHTHDSFAHLVRVEANGYLAAESRDIKSNEGNVAIEFQLKKGLDIAIAVRTPQGKPAANANIALGMAGSQISVRNGEFDGQTYATRGSTDASGLFSFPPAGGAYQLVILHPTGYAHLKSAGEPAPVTIQLTAWARVEGTFRTGKQPTAGVPIEITVGTLHSYGESVPSIFTRHDVTTGADGRFVFERVIPGNGRIGRRIMLTVQDGAVDATSSVRHAAVLTPGETAHIDIGGDGVPVIGKLQPPAGFKGAPLWNFALLTAQVDPPQPLRSTSPYITASVDREGRFRIDDMPAGEYLLTVRFTRNPVGRLSQIRFTVPPADRGLPNQLVDLGPLTLEGS